MTETEKTKKIVVIFCLFLLLVSCGCNQERTHQKYEIDVDDSAVAMVNGQAISRDKLLATLLPSYGTKVLDELVLLEVVRQYAGDMGKVATPEMIDAEFDRILNDMAPGKSRRQQEGLFEYMLRKRGLSRGIFELIIKKQVLLRCVVDPNVVISEQMLADEFQRQHGRRLVVRQLVVSNSRRIDEAQKRLQGGESFRDIIRDMSEDQISLVRDGLLGPFSRADEHIPKQVRQVAFELKQQHGTSENFSYYDKDHLQWWCILQLEDVIEPDDVTLVDIRSELSANFKRKIISQRMLDLQQKLKRQATIVILEPGLKK